jgi:hypothetical protein
MTRRPQATVRILRQPHLAPDAVRVEVDCRYSTTGLTAIPSYEVDDEELDEPLPLVQALAEAGSEGWELVGMHTVDSQHAIYIFKRPLAES